MLLIFSNHFIVLLINLIIKVFAGRKLSVSELPNSCLWDITFCINLLNLITCPENKLFYCLDLCFFSNVLFTHEPNWYNMKYNQCYFERLVWSILVLYFTNGFCFFLLINFIVSLTNFRIFMYWNVSIFQDHIPVIYAAFSSYLNPSNFFSLYSILSVC